MPFNLGALNLNDIPRVGVPKYRLPPGCTSVTLDPPHASSIFVDVYVPAAGTGMTLPSVFLGYETTDAGHTWKRIPSPTGNGWQGFGGFTRRGSAIQARFGIGAGGESDVATSTLIEETRDGGKSWAISSSTCGAATPCVRWGASPYWWPKCCGSVAAGQMLQASFDRGATWTNVSTESLFEVDDYTDLAIISARKIVLVRSGSDAGLLLSDDGARTWLGIRLPPLQDGAPPLRLQLLPNGDLLGRDSWTVPWQMLTPGAKAWCTVDPRVLPISAAALRSGGHSLWWIGKQSRSVPLDRLACASS